MSITLKPLKKVSSVHTIETSVANRDKLGQEQTDYIDNKYKKIVARKYFTSVLAAKLSAYEDELIKNGEEFGKWVTSCPHKVKEAIKQNIPEVTHEMTYRDGSKETHTLHTHKYGYMNGDKLVIKPHQKRWIRLFNCGSKIEKLTNLKGEVFFADKNHDCGDKMCMRCSRKKSWIDFIRYKDAILNEIDEPVMLVLHQRNPRIDKLEDTLVKMSNDLDLIRKQNSKDAGKGKCDKFTYYWAFEMTLNSKSKTYHPHYHIIINKTQAKEFLKSWIQKDLENRTYYAHGYHSDKLDAVRGNAQSISDVIKSEDELIECFKYITKISTDEIDADGNAKVKADGSKQKELAPIEMIYKMLMVIYGKRRNGAAGKLYNHRLTKLQSEDEVYLRAMQEMKKAGFNETDNPLVELCEKWEYDHKQTDYIGYYDGIRISLTNYQPTDNTKRFLRVQDG